MISRRQFWSRFPEGLRIAHGLCRRLARLFPELFAERLKNPVFVIGFSNGGKSTITDALNQQGVFCLYPDEGNKELWFRGFYPWLLSKPGVPPIWWDPDRFIRAVVQSREDGFLSARAYLGAYQWLLGGKHVLVCSGMLAALVPELMKVFPDARLIHVVRNGWVAAYASARGEWWEMTRTPRNFREAGCALGFQSVLERMAKYWLWTLERVYHASALKAGSMIEVHYEEWCRDPNRTVKDIMVFLGEGSRFITPRWKDEIQNLNDLILSDLSERERSLLREVIGEIQDDRKSEDSIPEEG